MIYTVTLNPSLDYIVRVRNFRTGKLNRTYYENVLPGGKGINVSIVLENLGQKSTALGFVAGFTGREIEARLKRAGVDSDFIEVREGMSRINVKLRSDEETEINGQGPKITDEDIRALFEKLDRLQKDDLLVISGSVPGTLPGDMYERILSRLEGKGIDAVVDAERDLLVNVLKYHPFLIKPNNIELGEIYGVKLSKRDEVIPYAKKLREEGARNVLVSMAGEGAVLISEQGEVLQGEAKKGRVVNSVGAGDSMVAGFLTGYMEYDGDMEKALLMGLGAGSASAFSPNLATRQEVEALLAGQLHAK